MNENTSTSETSSPEPGPASLREALEESFNELSAVEATEPESTESVPAAETAQPATQAGEEAEDTQPSEGQPQGEPEVIQAPEHWSAEDRAVFDSLPSAAQDSWLRREREYEQGIQKKAEEVKPLKEAFGQYRDMLKMRGIDEPTAIRTWVAAQQALDTDPVNGLKMLINQFGPDVQSALKAEFGEYSEPDYDDSSSYVDPEVQKLRSELQSLRNQNNQIEAQYATVHQQEAVKAVQAFKDALNDDGKPAHPYFEDVQDEMRALLQAGVAPDLDTAYEKAIWALPAYRDEFAESQRKQAEREASKRREEAANKAKRTAKSVNGKGSVPPPQPVNKTMKDDLLEAWNQSINGEM